MPHPQLHVSPYHPQPIPLSIIPSASKYPSAQHNTPPKLHDIILKAHTGPQPLPSKLFFQKFTCSFSKLDPYHFQSYCRMHTHCDQGANVGSVTDLHFFLLYVPCVASIQHVGGDTTPSPGWGDVLYRIDGNIYLQTPTYYCPWSPQNTFSPSQWTQIFWNRSIIGI